MAALMAITTTAQSQQPAFPGAEGFGMYTTGGRGGTVYHVTTLDDAATPGTLRYGLENTSGVRTIVFDVSGTIHLYKALSVKRGNVTIAGQTAPGDGICIADYPFTINTDNVIVRYLRFRLGNEYVNFHEGDGLGAMDHNNIIVDHCSISWSIDECCSVYGGKNLTVQWCMIDQSLVNSGHSKGAHGYGGNWGGSGCSYHHNLLAHHTSRAPRLGPRYTTQKDERLDMRNNVIYNWSGNGCYGGEGMNCNIVNNYYKPGPGTPNNQVAYRIASPGIRTTEYVAKYPDYKPMLHVWGTYYVDGNVNPKYPDVTADNWTKGIYEQVSASSVDNLWNDNIRKQIRRSTPIDVPPTTTHSAEEAYERVLAYAGASLSRDSHDTYIVDDTRRGKATYGHAVFQGKNESSSLTGFVNSPDEAGGYPVLKEEYRDEWFDIDGDGMSDAWETANGLNPGDRNDGATLCSDGYTNLEHYLNSIVQSITEGQNISLGITSPIAADASSSKYCYNLHGQRVSPSAKGVVIQNGKKCVK